MQVSDDLVQRVMDVLEEKARQGEKVTYKGLSEAVPGLPVRGPLMSTTLGKVCRRSHEVSGILITALVVNAGSGLPSDQFFELVRELRPDFESESPKETVARREQYRVYGAYPRT